MPSNKVTLQINLSPSDFPHVKYLLQHQLDILSRQVDEIILVVDTRPSKGRFSNNWHTYQDKLNSLLTNDIAQIYGANVVFVDYTPEVKSDVAGYFFGQNKLPDKDFRGGPFYAYFFGLFMAANDIVFHLDSDMFLGGGSRSWVAEALMMFRENPECLLVSPLPGPPHPGDILIGQADTRKKAPYTHVFPYMSTRIFMLDKTRFRKHKLEQKKPAINQQLKALTSGNSNADLPEHLITAYMKKWGLFRIDFLGDAPGLWSLHPPYRTRAFYEHLPELINKIMTNNLPESQDGFYDITDDVCDWTAAREELSNRRWWKRYFRIFNGR